MCIYRFAGKNACTAIFNSYAGFGAEVIAKYAAAVCREIAGRRKDVPVNANASIYFGGGTPSLLPAEAIKEITDALKKVRLVAKSVRGVYRGKSRHC